jgi:hypothetical protein
MKNEVTICNDLQAAKIHKKDPENTRDSHLNYRRYRTRNALPFAPEKSAPNQLRHRQTTVFPPPANRRSRPKKDYIPPKINNMKIFTP